MANFIRIPRQRQGRLTTRLTFLPVTPERWPDLTRLFEEPGPRGGLPVPAWCWCLHWRLKRSEFHRMSKFKKKECMHALVQSGTIPGILGYLRRQPIAWCSIGPREQYPSLERSSVLKRIDGERVWSMVCLYVSRYARGKGLVHELIKGALDYAKSQGATVVEAYPAVPQPTARVTMTFMGLPPMFRKAGFVEVAQPSKYRKIMRRDLIPARSSQASRRRISAAARTR